MNRFKKIVLSTVTVVTLSTGLSAGEISEELNNEFQANTVLMMISVNERDKNYHNNNWQLGGELPNSFYTTFWDEDFSFSTTRKIYIETLAKVANVTITNNEFIPRMKNFLNYNGSIAQFCKDDEKLKEAAKMISVAFQDGKPFYQRIFNDSSKRALLENEIISVARKNGCKN